MKFALPDAATRVVARQILLAKKNSPTILFVGGVVGVVATTVTACRATLKVEEVLVDHEKKAMMIKSTVHADYTETMRKRDMTVLYTQSAMEFTKLYGPSIIMGAVSIGMLTKSHNILNKRNAGLAAAHAAVTKAMKDYRSRVVEEYGEEKDREFAFGVKAKEATVEDSDGKSKKVKKKTFGDGGGSMYSKIFDEYNQNWSPHPEYNIIFLRGVQNMATDRLRARGHLFLYEVYEMLGMEHTAAGSQVGWVYGEGDDYVDLGIWEGRDMLRIHNFMTGHEGGVMLDFNVDGEMWHKIGKAKRR
jgi:hypothetical protein